MEVEIKFEPSGRAGVVAVGSYLFDAAKRMGIELDDECGRLGQCDSCAVLIVTGRELLSEVTAAEIKNLSESQRNEGKRLSCQAKIEKQGDLVVMVAEKQKTEAEKEEERKKQARKEFEDLPLEKKVANLLELEAITLSETISFVLNSPFAIAGKVMDVMAEFGLKLDDEAKKAKRPNEHAEPEAEAADGDKKQKKRGGKGKATETANETS
jgi:ferredoxin, 2Fe-2S